MPFGIKDSYPFGCWWLKAALLWKHQINTKFHLVQYLDLKQAKRAVEANANFSPVVGETSALPCGQSIQFSLNEFFAYHLSI